MDKAGMMRIGAGALVWAGLAGLFFAAPGEGGRGPAALGEVGSFLASRSRPVLLRFDEDVEIAVGDSVYIRGADGALLPIGEVSSLRRDGRPVPLFKAWPIDRVREVECSLRPAVPGGLTSDARARLLSIPQGLAWAVRTLIPPERALSMAARINLQLLARREAIFAAIAPVMRKAVEEMEAVIAEDLPAAVRKRAGEFAAIGKRLQVEVVERELRPLLETDIIPIIERRAKPTVQAIMAELLEQAPLWGFAWRFFYQTMPFTSNEHLRSALERFWNEQAVPILREHADDFLLIGSDIVAESADNPRVAEALRRAIEKTIGGEDVHHAARLLFQDLVLDNPRFHDALERVWASPEASAAFEAVAPQIEPILRDLSIEVLGSPSTGITPEFARVLRTQILEKDRRWVVIECGGTPGAAEIPRGAAIPAVVER